MVKYKLVNPVIKGDMKTIFDAKNPKDAAKKIWSTLSQYITNTLPRFAFTFRADKSYHHFLVEETIEGDDVKFNLQPLKINANSKAMKDFKKQLKQMGGNKDDKKKKKIGLDDDDLDDLKFLMNRYMRGPITYWGYYPFLYTEVFHRLGNAIVPTGFIPTFISDIIPYIEIVPPMFLYY